MNNNSINQFLQMARNGGNPQVMMMQILESQCANNPLMQNLLSMARSGNKNAIEQIVRNQFKENGRDFDSEFTEFRRRFGL